MSVALRRPAHPRTSVIHRPRASLTALITALLLALLAAGCTGGGGAEPESESSSPSGRGRARRCSR
ncbi:hypothetical protein ABMX48_13940 [Streptomyces cavourensis]